MNLKGSIVIAFSGHKYLMVRHSTRAWEFPGGRAEGNETPLETAKREFFEETGLKGVAWKECGIARLMTGNLALFTCNVAGIPKPQTSEITHARYFFGLPIDLSFDRPEYFQLLRMAGRRPKSKTDYDAASKNFDTIRSSPSNSSQWAKAMVRWGWITSSSKVLDIGCGTGRYSLEISQSCGAEMVGLDYSGGMLSEANAKFRGMWLRGDASSLPVEPGTFDAAIMMLVLQHVDDEVMAISEAWRILKPGGRLVIATVSHARIKRHIMRHFPGLVAIDLARFMPVPELKWHIRNIGFGCVQSHVVKGEPIAQAVDSVIERFRNRYISTLALVPEKDFEKNLVIFENRLRSKYGSHIENDVEITFIEARKPS
jgi:ubiquinone/menaquinone biosynthesis C-methylase UbiE